MPYVPTCLSLSLSLLGLCHSYPPRLRVGRVGSAHWPLVSFNNLILPTTSSHSSYSYSSLLQPSRASLLSTSFFTPVQEYPPTLYRFSSSDIYLTTVCVCVSCCTFCYVFSFVYRSLYGDGVMVMLMTLFSAVLSLIREYRVSFDTRQPRSLCIACA